MNKLVTSVLSSLALVFVASATPTWATLNVGAYGGDTSPSDANASKYTAYLCSKDVAEDVFDGYSVKDIENYLAENFSTDVPEGGVAFNTANNEYALGQYSIYSYTGTGYSSADYIAVAFYGSEAYRVFGLGSATLLNGSLIFDDTKNTENVGTWKEATAPVPEPTSGLLVLLGIAGLALKRRKA